MRKWGIRMSNYSELVKRHAKERTEVKTNELFGLVFQQKKEVDAEIEKDKTGKGFIYDMFRYEMASTEYNVLEDTESLINDLGINIEDFKKSKPLQIGFESARRDYMSNYS